MNSVKGILIFTSGLAIGLGAGMLYFRSYYEKVANQEIEEAYKVYRGGKFDSETVETTETSEDTVNITDVTAPDDIYESKIVAYNGYSTTPESDKKEREEELAEAEGPSEDRYMPYEITEIEFSEEELSFDKVSLSYYQDDDVLVDENEEEIISVDDYIGTDNLNIFSKSGKNCMYVRNEKISTDYEIVRVLGSFREL